MSTPRANRNFLLSFRSYILQQSRTYTTPSLSSPRILQAKARHAPTPVRSIHTTRPLHQESQSSQTPSKPQPQPQRESLAPQTHYEFFPRTLSSGPPPRGSFAIDLPSLRKEFFALQQKSHPDLFPASQKLRAEGLSARINEAYKTLQDPLKRAQYLLSLRGIDVAEDETAKTEDPELLMEVLEIRESIEEAQEEEELEPLKGHNHVKIEDSVKRMGELFEGDDIEGAKEEAVRLRYWMNVKESLDGWERGKPVVLVH